MKLDEWCESCKEYDQTTHSCPRFNHVIKTTLDDVRKEAYEQGRAMAQRWIPVTERLPEETDSIFARYYGTERWSNSMFRKRSKEVIVTTRFKDGTLHTETAHTNDGKWWFDIKGIQRDVIAWCEMPEPYKGEQG